MNEIDRTKLRDMLTLDGGDRGEGQPPSWLVAPDEPDASGDGPGEDHQHAPTPGGVDATGERFSRFGFLSGLPWISVGVIVTWGAIALIVWGIGAWPFT